MNKTTITGRLVNNEPPLQDYWPEKKKVAIAKIIYHWAYGSRCTGKECDVCRVMEELRSE